jgi:hypothetical protein
MTNIKTAGNTVKSFSKLYVICLILFALLSILSFAFLMIGIFGEHRKLIFLAGIWWSGWGSILGLTALPIGYATEIITGGAKGSMHRYVRWVLSTFLLTGACVSLFSLSIPSGKINPQTLLPLILMAIILSVLGTLPFFRVCVGFITFAIFIIHILALFLPVDFGNVVRDKVNDACFFVVAPKRVCITYESLKQGKIEFFRKDGKPKVWYYRKEDGTFDFFNGECRHPTYEVELKPVTREVIPLIEEQLKKEEQARQEHIEQEEQSRQKHIELERIRQEEVRQEQNRQEQVRLEKLKEERIKQEQIEKEHLRQKQLKKEQLDREEALRSDLMKPSVYMIEKKLGRFGSGLKAHLHRLDVLDDRTIRVTLLIENDTGSDVWIKMKEPDGCVVLLDNLGNRYNPKAPIEAYYTCRLPYNNNWLQLDFEPLKRNVGYLRFQGLMIAVWDGGYEHGKIKFEYTLMPANR